MEYFRENIKQMIGYIPGEQPSPEEQVIKLNTNENPYPPSPEVLKELKKIDAEALRRYPDPMANQFRRAVSRLLNVPVDWIIVTNGSDELLSIVFRACVGKGDKVAYPVPTYLLYKTLAEVQAGEVVEIPFDEDFSLPMDKLIDTRAKLTIISSPNSPSGTTYPKEQVDELAAKIDGLLLIDEAYVDFADEDCLELIARHKNVIILRTLSKGYSLAGIRLGFGIARTEILEQLFKVKDSYNVDAVAARLGAIAIADQQYKNANVEKIKSARAKMKVELERLGFRVWPSGGNFLLCRPPKNNAEEIYQTLKARGILIRYFNQQGLDDKLRITIGTEEQNGVLITVLKEIV
ncbi:MAG: histidinol-phosphate transaminase [Planctomycetes bacterium]|nr:histidinol-phosphate transaminase [Planctomycetota bacterium]